MIVTYRDYLVVSSCTNLSLKVTIINFLFYFVLIFFVPFSLLLRSTRFIEKEQTKYSLHGSFACLTHVLFIIGGERL